MCRRFLVFVMVCGSVFAGDVGGEKRLPIWFRTGAGEVHVSEEYWSYSGEKMILATIDGFYFGVGVGAHKPWIPGVGIGLKGMKISVFPYSLTGGLLFNGILGVLPVGKYGELYCFLWDAFTTHGVDFGLNLRVWDNVYVGGYSSVGHSKGALETVIKEKGVGFGDVGLRYLGDGGGKVRIRLGMECLCGTFYREGPLPPCLYVSFDNFYSAWGVPLPRLEINSYNVAPMFCLGYDVFRYGPVSVFGGYRTLLVYEGPCFVYYAVYGGIGVDLWRFNVFVKYNCGVFYFGEVIPAPEVSFGLSYTILGYKEKKEVEEW